MSLLLLLLIKLSHHVGLSRGICSYTETKGTQILREALEKFWSCFLWFCCIRVVTDACVCVFTHLLGIIGILSCWIIQTPNTLASSFWLLYATPHPGFFIVISMSLFLISLICIMQSYIFTIMDKNRRCFWGNTKVFGYFFISLSKRVPATFWRPIQCLLRYLWVDSHRPTSSM